MIRDTSDEKTGNKKTTLVVDISHAVPKDRAPPAMRAYLFDASQQLVTSVAAKERVELEIDPQQRYRVTVGPDLMHGGKVLPRDFAAVLVASGAISRDYHPAKPVTRFAVSVAENLVLKWLFVCIDIHGTVRKRLNPGGTPPSFSPVCTGIVQIFTIDLACSLQNLSDPELLAIKNQVLARMFGVEIADLVTFNSSDFAKVSALAAGLFPLTGNALRAYIVAHRAELARFMCNLIPESAICYQQLPDAPIQSDGTFSLNHCFLFWQAPPDIYFEVIQTIDGITREVADPDILCTTMFGYDGSQAAVITVEDPSAIACQPDPRPGPADPYVWPTAIGNIDLRKIDGLEAIKGTGLTPGNTPWGGTLGLQVQFAPNLRANKIHYYRWSYKFDGDAAFTQINASVTHRWQEVTFGPGPTINVHLHPVTLGPRLVGTQSNLFEVPDPTLPWIDIVDPIDRPFAYFDSTDGQTPGRSGMVTLQLEMFDSAGIHVPSGNAGHGGPFQFLLPDLLGTPDDYTNASAVNIDGLGNLTFRIQVDNNPTTASLPRVRANGVSSDDCGMLHYGAGGDPVSIEYVATHPNGFLDWSLSVSCGLHGTVASTSGHASSANPDHFDRPASALLVDNCKQAAFAVNLYCAARATDGYSRQSQYDRSATIAFALLTP